MSPITYFEKVEMMVGEKVNILMDKAGECVLSTKSYFEASPFLISVHYHVKEITGIDIYMFEYMNSLVDYILLLPPVPIDMIYSVYVGCFLALCIIIFNNLYPGEPMNWEIDYVEEMKAANKESSKKNVMSKEKGSSFHLVNEIKQNEGGADFSGVEGNIIEEDKKTLDSIIEKSDRASNNASDENVAEYLKDEDKVLKHRGIQKLKTFFGLKDEEIITAIRDARDEITGTNEGDNQENVSSIKEGKASKGGELKRKMKKDSLDDDNFTLNQIFNTFIYVAGFSLVIYYINHDYENAFTLWFQKTFPKEAKVLFRN